MKEYSATHPSKTSICYHLPSSLLVLFHSEKSRTNGVLHAGHGSQMCNFEKHSEIPLSCPLRPHVAPLEHTEVWKGKKYKEGEHGNEFLRNSYERAKVWSVQRMSISVTEAVCANRTFFWCKYCTGTKHKVCYCHPKTAARAIGKTKNAKFHCVARADNVMIVLILTATTHGDEICKWHKQRRMNYMLEFIDLLDMSAEDTASLLLSMFYKDLATFHKTFDKSRIIIFKVALWL